MSTLHIVSSSPFAADALDMALEFASSDDAIILIENAVYAAFDAPINISRLAAAQPGLHYYILKEDMSARAMFAPLADFKAVSYIDFVELVCRYNNSVSWS